MVFSTSPSIGQGKIGGKDGIFKSPLERTHTIAVRDALGRPKAADLSAQLRVHFVASTRFREARSRERA